MLQSECQTDKGGRKQDKKMKYSRYLLSLSFAIVFFGGAATAGGIEEHAQEEFRIEFYGHGGAPEIDWKLAHRIMKVIEKAIKGFVLSNDADYLGWEKDIWSFYPPYLYDLDADGEFEYFVPVYDTYGLSRKNALESRRTILVLGAEVTGEKEAEKIMLKYLGAIPAPWATFYNRNQPEPQLIVSSVGKDGWRSITTGPRVVAFDHSPSGKYLIGGERFCWTDNPKHKIDYEYFGWDPERVAARYGFPYQEGDPGYYLLVPESEPCPE